MYSVWNLQNVGTSGNDVLQGLDLDSRRFFLCSNTGKCERGSQCHNAIDITLWRHNEYDGVSNHQRLYWLPHRLFKRRSKKTAKLRVTGLCEEKSPVTGEFPSQRPVTRKMFPFDDVIMESLLKTLLFESVEISRFLSHCLAGMFDRDFSGTIGLHEFQGLWGYISQWRGIFEMFDRDRSGAIDANEFRNGRLSTTVTKQTGPASLFLSCYNIAYVLYTSVALNMAW